MNIERSLRLIAGAFVLISLALGYWVSPYWYLFTAFVGLNLFQSALHQLVPDDGLPAQAVALNRRVECNRSMAGWVPIICVPGCLGGADAVASAQARRSHVKEPEERRVAVRNQAGSTSAKQISSAARSCRD